MQSEQQTAKATKQQIHKTVEYVNRNVCECVEQCENCLQIKRFF